MDADSNPDDSRVPPVHPVRTLKEQTSSASSSKLERKTSNISQGSSDGGDKSLPRRVSISKASNLTVALSGGNPKSKMGSLRRRSNTVLATYKDSFVMVDDGDISFQVAEDDVDNREVYSLLAIREIKLLGPNSSQFLIKLAEQSPVPITGSHTSGSSLLSAWADFTNQSKVRSIVLKASSAKEALEWIATIKHELKNQILVCKNLFSTLQSEGHQERAEPLFEQIMELLKVVYDGREHFEVADTLRSYGRWLETQGRIDEAALMKKQAKAIKRRCEEGLDSTLSRQGSGELKKEGSPEVSSRRLSSLRFPGPLKKV